MDSVFGRRRWFGWRLPLVAGVWALATQAAYAGVVINEIMANPGSVDWDGSGTFSETGDEWIEVYNAGGSPENIGNWTIHDSVGLKHRFPDGTIIDAGEFVVVYGSTASSGSLGLNNNAQDSVTLKNSGGTQVDTYAYDTHESDDERSTGRWPDGTGAFQLFDGLNSYAGAKTPQGNGFNPTPGSANAVPEPGSGTLLGLGAVALLGRRRRRRRSRRDEQQCRL